MSVIVECRVEPTSFPLGRAVSVPAGLSVVVDRIVPTARGPLPYLWVEGEHELLETYVTALRECPPVQELVVIDEFRRRVLCRIVWRADEPSLIGYLAESDVALLELRGRADGWLFRIRADHKTVRELHDHCRELGVQFEVRRIYRPFDWEHTAFGLTATQHDTLVRAVERGYYNEPRDVTLDTLADEFGVSSRAVSRRLRRATKRLVDNTLLGE